MSKVFIEESTLSSIGNAIRNKSGKTDLIAPQDMATEITNLTGGGGSSFSKSLVNVLSRSTAPFTISKEEIEGITKIGNYACQYTSGLSGIEFPDSLERIEDQAFAGSSISDLILPENLNYISGSAFDNLSKLKTVMIKRKSSKITTTNSILTGALNLTSISVPSKLYDEYLRDVHWNNPATAGKFVPYGEWVLNTDFIKTYMAFSQTKNYVFSLIDFDDIPSVSVVSSNTDVVEVSEAVVDSNNTQLTITVRALDTEGDANISVTIIGKEGTYTFNNEFTIMETIPESTYEVVAVDGATYGFELNENDFYVSKNKGVQSSYAICQINISNLLGKKVCIDCISYGENNYDYGILSYPNETLKLTNTVDTSIYKSFKGLSSPNIQTVEYTTATGDCFIQVKYIKDGSGDNNNDTLQFMVRFEG